MVHVAALSERAPMSPFFFFFFGPANSWDVSSGEAGRAGAEDAGIEDGGGDRSRNEAAGNI